MAFVYVSIGSNTEREHYIKAAIHELTLAFGKLTVSPVYESEAVGFEGDNFYNLVAGFESSLSVAELSATLKAMEDKHGRDRSSPKFSGRTLDIDILTYDALVGVIDGVELPRSEITRNAFVLQPLADIAPEVLHPSFNISYSIMWKAFDKKTQLLWPIEIQL